ncbi:MAG TPA: FprA family A-type flavoprotein [Candidatus Krumholzibacterium sp.]|nr:FprA family A-type flavoprotein [Candidatus Krumholzibacterium sp.]
MKSAELKPGVHWVGGIDWDIRNFHGYLTQRGTTYNAYLVVDEKTVLIDTVKDYLFDEMLSRIRGVVDPADIDYIVSNHVEMDHSGSLPKMLELAPRATIVTSVQGEKGLERHFKRGWDMKAVQTGEELPIGRRTLKFVHTPMLHWPDNMVTYLPEEKILFSNDAFGQHIATPQRFDDEVGWEVLREEAAKYFANIVLPYVDQGKKAIDSLAGLDIDIIATSHGVIWRSMIPQILGEYTKWSTSETEPKALIVYDSMWGSTEKMARALHDGLEEEGIPVSKRNLKTTHISDIFTEVLTSRLIMIGCPTLNNGMLPTVGAFLTYLKGLKPRKRIGMAFGSYGWGGQAAGQVEEVLKELKWELPFEKMRINYVPDDSELDTVRARGRELAKLLK